MLPRVWQAASCLLLLCAVLLRLYALELRPLHHDEGVNGLFLLRLFRENAYRYDPANYHGPTLYYLALPFVYLFGLNTWAIRLTTVVFGLLTVWLLLDLRRRVGAGAVLIAVALFAVSPGTVFFSRYFIHETLLVCWTLGLVVQALRYGETADPKNLVAAAAFAALLVATKETAVVTLGVFVIALACTTLYARLRKKGERRVVPNPAARTRADTVQRMTHVVWWVIAIQVFVSLFVLFFSSFATSPQGVRDALRALAIWVNTGHQTHQQPWYQYLVWLWREDASLLVLGVAGGVCALWRFPNRFLVWTALWAFGIMAAYSLVPYKTPWIVLNFLLPLAILGGYVVGEVWKCWGKVPAIGLAGAAILVSLAQTADLNFVRYDDERHPYVYVHTRRTFLRLVGDIHRYSAAAGTGVRTPITVTSPEHWPLPWYLRGYGRVGYVAKPEPADDAVLIVAASSQEADLAPRLGNRFHRAGVYALRPGVVLVLYVRRDLV